MSILSRMSAVVKAKMNRILDEAEKPQETVDYAYEKLNETIRDVHRGVEEIRAAKERLRVRGSEIRRRVGTFDTAALQAISDEMEDAARVAIQRREAAMLIVEVLHQKILDLDDIEGKLTFEVDGVLEELKVFRTSMVTLPIEPVVSPAERVVMRALAGSMFGASEDLSIIMNQAMYVLGESERLGIPEDFSGEDAVRIIGELAPIVVAQSIEDQLAYLQMLNPSQ